jgi:hypothetical protein
MMPVVDVKNLGSLSTNMTDTNNQFKKTDFSLLLFWSVKLEFHLYHAKAFRS